jgi:hypothetical protein
MNYLFTYLGKPPEYIKYCLNAVMSVDKDAKIYFSSDYETKFKDITFLSTLDIASDITKEVEKIDLYNNTNYAKNPLWNSSLLRIFYLVDMCKAAKLKSFVHFDLDVLIYKPFEEIKKVVSNDRFNITACTDNEIIFGYSSSNNIEKYEEVTKSIFQKILKSVADFNQPMNEMKLLAEVNKNSPDLFNLLPILPDIDCEYLFDPASYGQFLGGIHGKKRKVFSRGWTGSHHYIGREINKKTIKVKFKNNSPVVIRNKQKYDLVNLHIHSKNLSKFLPKEYKSYV